MDAAYSITDKILAGIGLLLMVVLVLTSVYLSGNPSLSRK